MKKLMNAADDYVSEALAGLALAHGGAYSLGGANGRVISRSSSKPTGLVGVVTGGGFGHLPLFAGYVGEGLVDVCAVGNVFAGPSLDDVAEALTAADRGAGVLSVIGNYGGDTMVFGMAAEMARERGLDCETVIVADDVASAPRDRADTRRGVAGLVLAFKIAGAAAEAGQSLSEVKNITERAMAGCHSIGVALSPCTVPQAGKPTFELAADSIEIGMGIHGEKGLWRGPIRSADMVVDEMLGLLLDDMGLANGASVTVLVNSLGATPLDELYIMYRRAHEQLSRRAIKIGYSLVGHYSTSMEMAGASISLMRLDDELLSLLNAPAHCPLWRA
jgi:dihydroxyacetone kinase-like protein